jgi:4-diphosphocytidyl-2-C-methyl-D-erythritol kinase
MSAAEPGVEVVRIAPAKLNLTLAVTGRRADGYHTLHSIMVPLGLADGLAVRVAGRTATADTLEIDGFAVVAGPGNLVLRAIEGARTLVTAADPGAPAPPFLSVRLVKRVPVAAGLGGGSSDAAAAIEAALAAWGAGLPAGSIDSLAAGLGSDVPFFRAGRGAVVTGRGEFVEPLPVVDRPPAVLLVTPRLPVSTAAVFAAYASGHRPVDDAALRISEALSAELRSRPSGRHLLERAADLAVANDLRRATIATAPALAGFSGALGDLLDRPVCQSGSGPTLWVLYPALADAERAARAVRRALASGGLPAIGDGEPFVAATPVAMGAARHDPESSVARARTVHNDAHAQRTDGGRK